MVEIVVEHWGLFVAFAIYVLLYVYVRFFAKRDLRGRIFPIKRLSLFQVYIRKDSGTWFKLDNTKHAPAISCPNGAWKTKEPERFDRNERVFVVQ